MLSLAESYLHALDPFAIQFSERHGIRWYGLAYAVGFVIAWAMISWRARRGRSPLEPRQVGDLMCWVIVGVLVGGRLGWAIFYERGRPLIELMPDFPWWRLLAIMDGGMASHGGMIGVIAVCWIYARRQRLPILPLLDLGALVCTPGLFLGRLANFVNGELWGRPLPASMQAEPPWWSVKYPQEILLWKEQGLHDSQHLGALDVLRDVIPGHEHFYANVVVAAQAGNEQVIEVVRPLLTAYYPSQIFQAITDGPILLALLVLVWCVPRKPGVVGSWFLIFYGVLRIATEVFREPDAGVALFIGLSRGQLLSALMVVAGIVALPIVARRDVQRV